MDAREVDLKEKIWTVGVEYSVLNGLIPLGRLATQDPLNGLIPLGSLATQDPHMSQSK
jgi:hypothetical protein